MSHDIRWYSPAPLWPKRLQNGTGDRLQRPELLQFKQDDFMAEFQTTLENTPNALDEKRAEGEKYLGQNGTTESVEGPIPLYQPAHERYYLVTASLVCRERGLPDRAIDTANEEKAAFVLRRLVPDVSGSVDVDGEPHAEYRWVKTPAKKNDPSGDSGQNGSGQNGAATAGGKTGEWRRVDNPLDVPEQEERLSMFPQSYAPQTPAEQMKGKRRLWSGLIPVAKRDTYETASIQADNAAATSEEVKKDPLYDPRETVFETRVVRAFKDLRDSLYSENPPARADVRDPLLFAWLDFWKFLEEYLPSVAEKIEANEPAQDSDFEARGKERMALIDALDAMTLQPELGSLGTTAATILRSVVDQSEQIASGKLDNILPVSERPSLGPSGGPRDEVLTDFLNSLLDPNGKEQTLDQKRPELQKKVSVALTPLEKTDDTSGKANDLPENLQPPTTDPTTGGTYVVRCLYERPNCPEPMRTQVSERSRPFHLASFFDSKAPPRDINITLPGASMQELRDSSQSVSMVFTKELRRQAERVQNVTMEELKKGEVDDAPQVNLGMICSLSIPIITICALVLLLIIVVLLNIVFWWLPFFKICFPLPSSDS